MIFRAYFITGVQQLTSDTPTPSDMNTEGKSEIILDKGRIYLHLCI